MIYTIKNITFGMTGCYNAKNDCSTFIRGKKWNSTCGHYRWYSLYTNTFPLNIYFPGTSEFKASCAQKVIDGSSMLAEALWLMEVVVFWSKNFDNSLYTWAMKQADKKIAKTKWNWENRSKTLLGIISLQLFKCSNVRLQ